MNESSPHHLPNRPLRTGYTTGACACAAAVAACQYFLTNTQVHEVRLIFPDGHERSLDVQCCWREGTGCAAEVIKDAGDDPDITHGIRIRSQITPRTDDQICFHAGEGVGTVTRRGLALPPGEPAINPGPREMIRTNLRRLTRQGFDVTIHIPDGKRLAQQTFNPKLGIVGGLSVLGRTGIVRPYSLEAMEESFRCHFRVLWNEGKRRLCFVPGNLGRAAALGAKLISEELIVEVSNSWGVMIDYAAGFDLDHLWVVGHPGKLTKLMFGHWNTHSRHSPAAAPLLLNHLQQQFPELPSFSADDTGTVEALIQALTPQHQKLIADHLAGEIRGKILARVQHRWPVDVALCNLKGEIIGQTRR